ncbi:MAG: VOC family protein [Acidimicrobiia bacterium]|nr:VOC family protein [Acidimicrobiia bacterium]
MSDRYLPGVPCWVDTNQPDPEAAIKFYRGLFGWELTNQMPSDAPGQYYMARLGGGDVAAVSSIPEGAPEQATWNTYIWVEDADESIKKALQAGGTVISEPFDVMDSGRMAVLADPEGAVFSVWQPDRHRGASVVNQHGAFVFNTLNVRDLERATDFYGAVFGWKPYGTKGSEEFWAQPGYGDLLEDLHPGTRARNAEMGMPGFEDVVATRNPIAADSEITPHWSVTFGVDDADKIAERAEQLGGEVVVPPYDAPWVRQTEIRDPQGAMFTASKYVPQNQ